MLLRAITSTCLAFLTTAVYAAATLEPAGDAGDTGTDAGVDAGVDAGADAGADAALREEEPPPNEPAEPDAAASPDDGGAPPGDAGAEPVAKGFSFAKGDMEIGIGLIATGTGDDYLAGLDGAFAYYLADGFGIGLELQYGTVFSDFYDHPQSFDILPFVQYVFLAEDSFSPYVVVTGGRAIEWGGNDEPYSNGVWGVSATDSWMLGGGIGAYVGLGGSFGLKIQLTVIYAWYSGDKVFGYDDDETAWREIDGVKYVPVDPDCDPATEGSCSAVRQGDDPADKTGNLLFPLITVGFTYFF